MRVSIAGDVSLSGDWKFKQEGQQPFGMVLKRQHFKVNVLDFNPPSPR